MSLYVTQWVMGTYRCRTCKEDQVSVSVAGPRIVECQTCRTMTAHLMESDPLDESQMQEFLRQFHELDAVPDGPRVPGGWDDPCPCCRARARIHPREEDDSHTAILCDGTRLKMRVRKLDVW